MKPKMTAVVQIQLNRYAQRMKSMLTTALRFNIWFFCHVELRLFMIIEFTFMRLPRNPAIDDSILRSHWLAKMLCFGEEDNLGWALQGYLVMN